DPQRDRSPAEQDQHESRDGVAGQGPRDCISRVANGSRRPVGELQRTWLLRTRGAARTRRRWSRSVRIAVIDQSFSTGADAGREERKVITAVFVDLVGSTALAERLDPEDVRLVVGEAVTRVVREVERLGGYVKDLAGDGVLAFFGAPVSYEDDAERAVRAG